MDHTFGHQEILDSLSHGSGKKSPSSAGSHRSSRISSVSSNGSGRPSVGGQQRSQGGSGSVASNASFVVDEAYRRQGKRLSFLAHGEMPSKPPVMVRVEPSPQTSFHSYRPSPPSSVANRLRNSAILQKLIFEAKYSFRRWEDTDRLARTSSRRKKDGDARGLTGGVSQMSLQQSGENWDKVPEGGILSWKGTRGRTGEMRANSKGLLSAVLESHSDSNTSTSGPAAAAHADRSTHTSPSQSISTKDSKTVQSSSVGGATGTGGNSNGTGSVGGNGSESAAPAAPPGSPPGVTRGRCLTVPSQATSNAGLDNIEGNLIVHENDVLTVPRKSLHTFGPKDKSRKRSHTFRIQKLLGQGTFAQVFQCLHEQTGDLVAVKIVKSKPAYTRQATVEIDVFRALQEDRKKIPEDTTSEEGPPVNALDYMVNMNCYFMYQSHLCLVFQLLGLNLYELLKRRQFRGLPLAVVQSIVKQSLQGIKELSHRSIVHCDLKPENVLVVSDDVVNEVVNAGESSVKPAVVKTESDSAGQSSASSMTTVPSSEASRADTIQATNRIPGIEKLERGIKLIDFGSACFEGYTAHTYIQSRFYRSPEVILGLPYDSAIDMWSLGCVAAELLLGLPILPGVHEHDQLCRIEEMIAKTPDWMLEQGTKANKYYVKFMARPPTAASPAGDNSSSSVSITPVPTPTPPLPQWRLKSLQEYIRSLTQSDIEKKGGLAKLEKPPGNRYFRKKSLSEILKLHASSVAEGDKALLNAFVHFLHGILDPDPWKRWTAFQAVQHPFITGQLSQLKKKSNDTRVDPKETNLANLILDYYWKAPWDPAICRRKLLNVQKMREKQQAMRRTLSARSPTSDLSRRTKRTEPSSTSSSRVQPSLSGSSPPRQLDTSRVPQQYGMGGKMVDTTPQFAGASSVDRYGDRTQLTVNDGSVSMRSRADESLQGPQSVTSGAYEYGQFVDADFAYALQRPGVVPASSVAGSSVAGSYSSQNAPPPVHIPDYLHTESSAHHSMSYSRHQGRPRSPQSFAGVGYQDQQSVPGTAGGYASTSHMTHEYRGTSSSLYGDSSRASSVASSAASSVTNDTSLYSGNSAHGQMAQQAPYMTGMFQQQVPGMQQMQMQGSSSQAQFGMAQGGQMGMQQAPMVTQVQAPDGNFYFVMTSPTGQMMLLQPVGAMNQAQQMPMYGGQSGMVQNQQTQGRVPSAQFVPQQSMQFSHPGQMQPGQMQPGQIQPDQIQPGQMGVSQGQAFQTGMQFAGGAMNPQQAQFRQQQQQQQQFYQPQMQQQAQFQQQQQFYQPQMQMQAHQYGSLGSQSMDQSSQGVFQSDGSHNPGRRKRYPKR